MVFGSLSFARHLAGGSEPSLTIAAGRAARPFRRIIAVTIGPNPTYDYYLAPRRRAFPDLPVTVALLEAPPPLGAADLADALIFFCRYATPFWLDLIDRHRDIVAGTALLLDDDLAALPRERAMPLAARRRFYHLGVRQWPRLSRVLDRVFVSTPALAARLPDAAPRLMPPLADDIDLPAAPPPRDGVTVAFHGTRTHGDENRWLMPIVENVVRADPAIRFEILARGRLAPMWRRIERVRVVSRRAWPDYRQDTLEHGPDIMLAPLLPSRLNAGRAETKRIDAARSGAALLVSDASIYHPSPEEAALGMLHPLDPGRWVQAILSLAADETRRHRLAGLNREHLLAARAAEPPFLVTVRENGRDYWRFSDG